jgi:hypothetical protein
MTKIYKPLFAVLVIYILCFIFRFIEYFIIRTDQTFWGEAFLHKLLGIVVLFIAAKLYNFKAQDIGFNKNRAVKYTLMGLLFGICIYVLAYSIEIVIAVSNKNFQSLQLYVSSYSVDKNIGNQTSLLFFVICIIGNIINVIMEEGIFRGLFTKMLEKNHTFFVSVLITSVLFGLWHFIGPVRNYFDGSSSIEGMYVNIILLVTASGFIGFKFALLTKLTGSIYMAMGDHFVNNTIINIFHIVSSTGCDELIFLRIAIAQSVSFIIVLFVYLHKKDCR